MYSVLCVCHVLGIIHCARDTAGMFCSHGTYILLGEKRLSANEQTHLVIVFSTFSELSIWDNVMILRNLFLICIKIIYRQLIFLICLKGHGKNFYYYQPSLTRFSLYSDISNYPGSTLGPNPGIFLKTKHVSSRFFMWIIFSLKSKGYSSF